MGADPKATMSNAMTAARNAMAANPPATSMAATPPTPQIPLSRKWDESTGNTVQGLAKSLTSMGLIDRGSAMQIGEKDINNPTSVKLTVAKAQGGKQPNVSSSLGTEGSAMYLATMGLKDMFDEAQARNLKTRDQFVAAYDGLINTIKDPKIKALYRDPKFKFMLPNFNDVAGQKFADLNK